MNKEAREFIDQICEHPVGQDDSTSRIMIDAATQVVNDEVNPILEILESHQQMIMKTIRLLRYLSDKIENIEGHLKNHDEKLASKYKRKGSYD